MRCLHRNAGHTAHNPAHSASNTDPLRSLDESLAIDRRAAWRIFAKSLADPSAVAKRPPSRRTDRVEVGFRL